MIEIEDGAFDKCINLKSICVDSKEMCKNVYDSLSDELKERVKEGSLKIFDRDEPWIDIYMYGENKGKNFFLPDDINVIRSDLFDGYRDKVVAIEADEVTTIEDGAFKDCKELDSVILPKASRMGSNAFEGCEKLLTMSIVKLDEIGDHVFDGCKNLSVLHVADEEDAIKIYEVLADDLKSRLKSTLSDEERLDIRINGEENGLNFDNILDKKKIDEVRSSSDFEQNKAELRMALQD